MFDEAAIRHYLGELGQLLHNDGVRGEMFVVGGAAMALAYNRRRATRDIDAIFEPKSRIYRAAQQLAEQYQGELPLDWLNDGVKGLLPGHDPAATVVFEHPGLVVRVASARYLFAMKVAASRVERDMHDIAFLFHYCRYQSLDEALDDVASVYPHLTLEPRSQYLLEEILANVSDEPMT